MESQLITRDISAEPLPTTVTPMVMLNMAVQQGADLDRLQKLMDLQERWEKNEARKAFVAAMVEFKRDPPEIFKTSHVKFGNTEYMHATIGDVATITAGALAEHGISHRWDVDQNEKKITVTCILTHALGHSESVKLTSEADTSGGKNAIQAIASATTYLQRYTLLAAAGLATKDQPDDDGRGAGTAQKPLNARPTSGAWEGMSGEQQAALETIAADVILYLAKDRVKDAYDRLHEEVLDADEKVALWTRFDSKQRAALTKQGKANNEQV